MRKRAGYGGLAYGGLYLALLLFLVNIRHLTALELLRLAALAAFLMWTMRSEERLARLAPLLLPFLLVFCAAQFDPDLGIGSGNNSSDGPYPGAYQVILPVLSTALLIFSLLCLRLGQGRKFPERLDVWVMGGAVLSAGYYFLVRVFMSQVEVDPSRALSVALLFLSYGALFVTARLSLNTLAREKTLSRAILFLFMLGALTGVVRVALGGHYCKDAEGYLVKGMTGEARGSLARASEALKGLKVGWLDARVEHLRGWSYLADGKYGEALKDAKAAEGLDSGYYAAYQLEGSSYTLQGKWEEALEAYETARRLAPSRTDYYPFLALAYSWTKQWDRGGFLKDYKGPLGQMVGGADNLAVLAVGLNKWGRYKEAEELSGKAVGQGLKTYSVYLQRGIAEEGLGKSGEAEQDYKAALGLAPDLAIAAYGRLEGLYARSGRVGESGIMRASGLGLETKEVELSGFTTTPRVYWLKDRMAFYENGSAAKNVLLYKGRFKLELIARGEPSRGVFPVCEVRLDSRKIGELNVDTREWKRYELTFEVNEPDAYGLGIYYVNDLHLPGDDRDLYVQKVSLRRERDAE